MPSEPESTGESRVACETVGCDGKPAAAVHWPGRTLALCERCALRAAAVALHLGFSLTLQALPVEK